MNGSRDWWGAAGPPEVVRVLREREATDEEIAAERARMGRAVVGGVKRLVVQENGRKAWEWEWR